MRAHRRGLAAGRSCRLRSDRREQAGDSPAPRHCWYDTGRELRADGARARPECPTRRRPSRCTHVVTGSAVCGSATELGSFSLGRGSGRSTAAQPNFTIGGVQDAKHDLIAYSYFQNGAFNRLLIRRDVAVAAATENIGPVNFLGDESFAPVTMTPGVTITGPVLAGETYSHSMSYLTTAACRRRTAVHQSGVQPHGKWCRWQRLC